MRSSCTAAALRILLCVACLASPAFSRTVRGIVSDPDGRPVAGAAVQMKNLVTLRVRSRITNKDGEYRFAGLNPQIDYELRATRSGQSSNWIRLSRYDEGNERTVDLRLK